MTSGGARTTSGPSPDPLALRRERPDDKAEWITLPVEGRDGDTPPWPLDTANYTAREAALWAALWQTPQAAAWEANHLEYEVGMLVRTMGDAEKSRAGAGMRTLVRQQMDSLGLTTPGMRNNRWKLSSDELGDKRLVRPSLVPERQSSRNRVKRAA